MNVTILYLQFYYTFLIENQPKTIIELCFNQKDGNPNFYNFGDFQKFEEIET